MIERQRTSDTPSTPAPGRFREPKDVECWGHRGASAHLPENTLASFRAAILEGADGIESDVHATSDGVVLMFHDPTLNRTTTGTGTIKTQPWKDVIEHVRTKKEPVQPIPLFSELIDLLMEPDNHHVSLNIDCKMQNDPEKLFPEMARIIATHENWQTLLAPRIILGLWHPLFIRSALLHLPLLVRYHIGFSVSIARTYFWDACAGFSLGFPVLMSTSGQAFLKECRASGKEVTTWTVNDPDEMRVALSWGIKAIMTDRVGAMSAFKKGIVADPPTLALPGLKAYTFGWSSWKYYSIAHVGFEALAKYWVGAHGALPSSEQLDDYLHTAPFSPPLVSPSANSKRTPVLPTATHAVDTIPAVPAPAPRVSPERRSSIVPESILNWVESTAGAGPATDK